MVLNVVMLYLMFGRLTDDDPGSAARRAEAPRGQVTPFPSPPPSPPSIELTTTTLFGEPFQTVSVQGTYAPLDKPVPLRVQRLQRGEWVSFPLPVVTDRTGNFTAHVDLGRTGRYRLRIMDPETETTSDTAVLYIR